MKTQYRRRVFPKISTRHTTGIYAGSVCNRKGVTAGAPQSRV
jgi:hypothetical protein